jgi:predicted GNAT superfamily acetyltransferase
MRLSDNRDRSTEHAAAIEAFHPTHFGFEPYGEGWINKHVGPRSMVVMPVSWQHAQVPSFDVVNGQQVATDPLNLICSLQALTWGMPPELLVPSNVLAIMVDTGGAILAAYDPALGFTAEGWLGFIIGLGSSHGTLVSHMLGVREDVRGAADVGWYVKLIQAYEGLRTGHHSMIWTFDPMRGANARLNLEKLGAVVHTLTIDKYGVLPSTLYGDVPSDRFTAHWDLLAPRTIERIRKVYAREYRGLTPAEVESLPEMTTAKLADLSREAPSRVRYRIPGDIDDLMRVDPQAAIEWRQDMRRVLPAMVTTKRAVISGPSSGDVAAVRVDETHGDYTINGFATGPDATGERLSYYVLERMTS